MKKASAVFAVFFLITSAPAAFAQMPLGVSGGMPAVSPSLERVGVVAAAHGLVELQMPGQAGRVASSGQPVFIGDQVKTDTAGQLQILLLDETVFTIGPNSSITIDKFVYDPQSHDGWINASIVKGVFRYVSGKIAAKRSDRVSINLPEAVVGFRGTIVGGSVDANGQGLVALLGPGNHNDAGVKNGSFSIEGREHGHHGEHRDVNRTGFGVTVGTNGELSGVFRLSDKQLNGLTQGLRPQGNNGHAGGGGINGGPGSGNGNQGGGKGGALGGGSVGTLSGETRAITVANSSFTGSLTNLTSSLNNTVIQNAQSAAANATTVPDGITTLEQLTRVASGTGYYDFTGTFTGGSATTGTISAMLAINFGNQTVCGSGSNLSITTLAGQVSTGNASFSNTQPFSNISNGTFTFGPTPAFSPSSPSIPVGTFNTINVTLSNAGGVTAQQAALTVIYTGNVSSPVSPVPSGSGTGTGTLHRS